MIDPADPRHDPFDAHAEAAVRDAAEAAEIQVPLERLFRQLVLFDAGDEQIVIVDALAAANDLAVAFRGQHVHAQRDVGPLRSDPNYAVDVNENAGSISVKVVG